MKLEISESLLRSIVNALQEQPYKLAAPALDELQKAINAAQGPQGFVKGNSEMREDMHVEGRG